MLRYFVVFLISIIHVEAQNNFTPGCSFSSGQCIYNVKLGHEQQCDVPTTRSLNNENNQQTAGTSGTSTTFQACSCKDVENLNNNMATLWKQMNQLQTNMATIASAFNVSKDQLGRKDWEIVGLLSQNSNLTDLLANKDMLLNKSQIELASTVQQMGAEITRLRNELANSNKYLSVCKVTLNVTGSNAYKPVLYGSYNTYRFDFEDSSNSNFTISTCSSSSSECWLRGSGRQNTMSGPQEDHTFGAPRGHYMYIDPYRSPPYNSYSRCTSTYTHSSRAATMTSPEFPPAREYCVRFWYTMYGSDIQNLKVYAKVGGGNGYPVMVKTGQEDKYWHMAQIPLTSEYTATPFKLVFEASTRSYYYNDYHSSISKHVCDGYGYTAFDDVYVYNTSCNAIVSCPPGSHKMVDGNTTSCYTFHVQAASWYDAIKTCKSETLNSHLVSINSAKEQKFLVDTIKHDSGLSTAGSYGWYTSGNDEKDEGRFVWSDTGYPYPLNYTNWHLGQPNNVGSAQDCLLMEYSGNDFEWGDVNCNDKHPFICETHV